MRQGHKDWLAYQERRVDKARKGFKDGKVSRGRLAAEESQERKVLQAREAHRALLADPVAMAHRVHRERLVRGVKPEHKVRPVSAVWPDRLELLDLLGRRVLLVRPAQRGSRRSWQKSG